MLLIFCNFGIVPVCCVEFSSELCKNIVCVVMFGCIVSQSHFPLRYHFPNFTIYYENADDDTP